MHPLLQYHSPFLYHFPSFHPLDFKILVIERDKISPQIGLTMVSWGHCDDGYSPKLIPIGFHSLRDVP